MLRHIVLIRFAQATRDPDRDAVLAALTGLERLIPGALAFTAGPNISPEGMARGYTHVFTADFIDEAARDRYLIHPAHLEAGQALVGASEGGRDGLIVVDVSMPLPG